MRYETNRRLYEALPVWIKHMVCLLPFKCLAGKAYRRVHRRGKRLDAMSRREVISLQQRLLHETLEFVCNQVPAYASYAGLLERLPAEDVLRRLPLVDKEQLQESMAEYLPKNFNAIPHYECSTGGTSGNQLALYLDEGSQSVEIAFMHRQWARVGYTPTKRKAMFRGVAFRGLAPGVYWQDNPVYNEVQFSPFHMSDKTLASYVERLRSFRPEYIHGYPSAIDILAEYVLRNSCDKVLSPISAVLLGSEACLPGQRERIERAFSTRVYTWYGHTERLILGGECETSHAYHQFPDYGYLEILKEDGEPCGVGERGEIVGTGFLNRSLPLVRYRTGDYATRLEPACTCGRHWDRFVDVKGRWEQNMVIGTSGARISVAALNMHGPMFQNVIRYQYRQTQPGVLEIRVLPSPAFAEEEAIRRVFQEKLAPEIDVIVRVVDDIPLTARGKLKRLVSTLS